MGIFLDRMVCEELMVKLKPKICEGKNPAEICDVSIPGRRNSQAVRPWGRDQPQEMIQQQGASVTDVCYSKCDGAFGEC